MNSLNNMMRYIGARQLVPRFISLLTLFFSCLALSTELTPIKIFVLSSGSSDSPWTQSVSSGIVEGLNQADIPYIYFIDHLDAGRFDEQAQHNAMHHYLTEKFAHKQPSFFISIGPAASSFSTTYSDLFPTAKRVLIQPKLDKSSKPDNAIIIETEVDYTAMVKDAIRLSKPKQVFIVGDSKKPSDQHRIENISTELKIENIPYKTLENQPLTTLINEISNIPPNSAIFFTPVYREHQGEGLVPVKVLEKLYKATSVPIFATSVKELDFGAVGGYLHSPKELGMMAGESIANNVKGKVSALSHNGFELVYNWNELVRWGYQNRIADHAEIRFKTPTLWQEYKLEMIIFGLFFTALVTILVAVTIYNRKLKRVQNDLNNERFLLEKKVSERTQELSILHKKAEEMARIDALTGINNRRAFFEFGEMIHNQTERTKSPYGVMMIDIDLFKVFNDTYGHAAGDHVLKVVATTVANTVRKSDIVARIGGEEFAVIMPNTLCQQVKPMAERIRQEIEKAEIKFDQLPLKTTISMGCSEYRQQDKGVESVLARADKALYRAKARGRNRVCTELG